MKPNSPECSHILLVDDEEMVRNLLKRALEMEGHTVFLAASKKDAFESLENHKTDLLIVDKNLPDGSGLDFIDAARNMDYDGEAIVITGYSDTDSAIQSVALGVFRYVRKPFDLDALKVDIRRALETGRLRKALANRTKQLETTNAELLDALTKIKESELRRVQSERLATIGYLAAGVAHEINNPLSLLSMTIPYTVSELEVLLRTNSIHGAPDKTESSLHRMYKSLQPTQEAVELLMGLASDLHSLGKTDSIDPQPVKMADAINSALRIVRHQLKHKAKITVDVSEDLTIKGHVNRLIQIFINLLTNAGRAIPEGAPDTNRIEIKGYEDGQHIVVEVADTGVGIPNKNLEKIFNRFVTFQVNPNQKEGSGIGLSIVKELVEEHKGTVNVVSEEGVGTRFYLNFPIASVRKSYPPLTAVNRSATEEFIRARRTILFVDDDLENLNTYRESFGQMHNVLTSRNTQEAELIIQKHREELDVVVCELSNQGPPFDELYHKEPDLNDRFIFIGDECELFKQAQKSGYQVLSRPVRPAVLLAAIYKIPPRRPSQDT